MTFKNIFDNGSTGAGAAEEASQGIRSTVPGARPEWEGVDPELFEGVTLPERDPKLVRETSPEALGLLDGFVTPLFQNTQTAADAQRGASEDPASTADMAASTRDEASTSMDAEIPDEDRPAISEKERDRLRKDTEKAAENSPH